MQTLTAEMRRRCAEVCGWPDPISDQWEPKEWRSQHLALIRKVSELSVKTGNAATCVKALKLMAVTGSVESLQLLLIELLDGSVTPTTEASDA